MMSYSDIIKQLSDRYNPEKERLVESKMFSSINSLDTDVTKYIWLAMNEVDSSYTQKVVNAGNAVKATLLTMQCGVQYEFQGSVMTQTHIKAASDIDLLTITTKFSNTEISKVRQELQTTYRYSCSEEAQALHRYSDSFSPYVGNVLQDLRELRLENEQILTRRYSNVVLKPKSIKVRPQLYGIDVDVVAAAWFDSFDYARFGQDKTYRGISIYNKKMDIIESPSLPFLAIERINGRSAETQGRLKKMIRFLKNVIEDLGKDINLTSFEINAICYDIPRYTYENAIYLELVYILWEKLRNIAQDSVAAMRITSVDGTEFVFAKNPDRYPSVTKLRDLVWGILQQLKASR